MTGKVIYRGPIEREPRTINLPVAGAYLPGILVTEDGTNLTVATAADMAANLLILGNVRFIGQSVTTAYASGDTGIAFEPRPQDAFQVALAAGTYAKGDNLCIGASGHLTAVVDSPAGDVVFARFDDTPGTFSAGDLADVVIANSFTAPAS